VSGTRKIAANAMFLLIGNLMSKALMFCFMVVAVRKLTAESFGELSVARTFVILFSVLVDFGITNLIVRDVSNNHELAGKYFVNIVLLRVVCSLVCLVFFLILPVAFKYNNVIVAAILIMGCSLFFDAVSTTIAALLQAFEKMQYNSYMLIFPTFFLLVAGFIVLSLGYGILAVAVVLLFVSVLRAALSLSYIKLLNVNVLKAVGVPDFLFLKQLVKNALPLLLVAVMTIIYHRIDIIMLSKMQNTTVVGWYSAAYQLLIFFTIIPAIIGTAVFPLMNKKWSGTVDENFKRLNYNLFRLVLILTFPVAVFITAVSSKLILLLYGPEYQNSVIAIQILIWGLIFQGSNNILGRVIFAIGKEKYFVYISFAALLSNVTLNFILIPKYSYVGAAIATNLSFLASMIVHLLVVDKFAYYINLFKIGWRPLLSSIPVGVAALFFRDNNILVSFVFSFLILVVFLIVTKTISKEDVILLKRLYAART